MPYVARTNGKCTCPSPCSSCLRTWDLLPCLVLLLLGLDSSVLLVLCLPIATLSLSLALAFALDNISELVIELEMFLESIERSQHGTIFLSPGDLAPQVPLGFR